MMNSIKKVLGFMLALALIVGMIPTFATNVYADEGKWIYVDGVNGSDSNDGSEGSPVQSWAQARKLLGEEAGGVYVSGTVTAVGPISTMAPGSQTVKRSAGFNGVMFEVPGGAEVHFYNVDIDGENRETDAEVIKTNEGAKVYFRDGAVFHNIGYGTDWNPYTYTGGIVVSIRDGVEFVIDGATFRDNNCKGIIHYTDVSIKNCKVTMKSGVVRNNTGFLYCNESVDRDNNLITIYDGIIANNDGTPYESALFEKNLGVIYICGMGKIEELPQHTVALFDNTKYDFIQPKRDDGTTGIHSIETMLGGGKHNWQDASFNDYVAYKSAPSQADKDNARAVAKSFIENNNAVINSNGTVRFGHNEGEEIPPTPSIPPEDDTPTPEEPKEFEVEISKVEVNGKEELPGAELKIESSDVEGFETISWTSGTETKKFTLKAGTYTLTEVAAPENYELAEPITFVVSEDGKVTVDGSEVSLVRMEDPRKEEPNEEEPPEEPEDCEPPTDEPPTEEPPTEEPPTTDEPPKTEEPPTNNEPPAETPSTPEVPETPTTAGNPPPQLPSTGRPEQPQNNTPSTPADNPPQLPSTGTPGAPNTGDESNMILWMGLATLAAISSVVIRFVRRER